MNRSNLAVMSLPRSGSTWFAERTKSRYEMTYLDEPLRTGFGQPENPMYHSKFLTRMDFEDPKFWEMLDPATRCKLEAMMTLRDCEKVLLKETNNIFQIDFLRRLLPGFDFIFLKRHIGGVLNSLLKTDKVWVNWSFEDRVRILRANLEAEARNEHRSDNPYIQKCINEYRARMEDFLCIFERADGVEVRGDETYAQMLAYLSIQSLEAQRQVDRVLCYEDMVANGLPNDLIEGVVPQGQRLEIPSSEGYSVHSTRNPSDPYAWVGSMSDEDWEKARMITGQFASRVFPVVEPEDIDTGTIPSLTTIRVKGTNEYISNRPVSSQEFEQFMAELNERGIPYENIFYSLGFTPSSTHNFGQANGGYFSLHPEKPIVHISPLAALAYAIYQGYTLPSDQVYKVLQAQNAEFEPDPTNSNFDDFGKLKRIGQAPQVDRYIDLYGNITEFALRGDDFVKVGGSYKDPRQRLPLDFQQPALWFQRDTESGFRLGSPLIQRRGSTKDKVVEILQHIKSPSVVLEKLLFIQNGLVQD